MGFDGWPDRLVVYAPGRHVFIEWKQPGGSLTAAQKIRIPLLRQQGEVVFIFDNTDDLEELLEVLS